MEQLVLAIRSLTIPRILLGLSFIVGLLVVVAWSFTAKSDTHSIRFAGWAILIVLTASYSVFSMRYARFLIEAVRHNLALALFFAYEMGGALYTRYVLHSDQSFFGHALGLFSYFLVYAFALRAGALQCSLVMLRLVALTWPIMLLVVIYGFATGQHLAHEIMYIFTPLPMYLGLVKSTWFNRIMATGAILVIAGLGLKNTTLITGAIAIYVLWIFSDPSVRTGRKPPVTIKTIFMLAIVGVVFYGLWTVLTTRVSDFSSGNTDFRTYNYHRLWNHFLESPGYGDGFVGTPNLVFDLYTIDEGVGTQDLPSHSDALDILAHGGLVGAAIFAVFLVQTVIRFLGSFWRKLDDREYAVTVVLFTMFVCGLFTMTINPILGNMSNAFLFWSLAALSKVMLIPDESRIRNRILFLDGHIAEAGSPQPVLAN